MCDLAKYIKQLDERLPQEKLNRVLQFIIEGPALCISLIKSDPFSKCLAAPVTAEDLRSLRGNLEVEYSDLSLGAIIAVLNSIPVVLPPSQGIPPQAVGIEEPRQRVSQLLDMEIRSVIAVVIYGQGGIGKTTLATTVFNKLDLKNYKFCRIDMEQDCSEVDLKLLQHQILRDLFHRNIELRSLNEGREELSKEFKAPSSQPVFIFVDNALRENDLEKLLPITDLASLPPHSRILVTTRNLNETRIILQAGIERYHYQVPFLPHKEAQKLLCEFALGSREASFHPAIDIDGLLNICQGIPLVLKMAGARLREHAQNIPTCRETVEYLKSRLVEGEGGDLSERMVDFVFNRLEPSCKEAFLDIVFFFSNWKRRRVACSVGETELQELERAALVNITDKRRVNVHDIGQARGKRLSPDGERITDLKTLTDVLQNEERIKKIKGIALSGEFELGAHHLNLMNRCLRVLIAEGRTRIGGGLKVLIAEGRTGIINGECKEPFENLRLLWLDSQYYSLMDLSKHPRLAVFIGGFYDCCEFSGGASASALKYMSLQFATMANLTTTFSQLQSLRVLNLRDCKGFDNLPETIGNLTALEKLDLRYCECLVRLPDRFGQLCCLSHLRLDVCRQLSALPESFGNLASLELLTLRGCWNLRNLPQNFGQLKRLKYVSINGCRVLQSLSDDFECLSSLIAIYAVECSQLEGNTMDKLVKMKGLMIVDIGGSPLLEERWEQVKEQYSLAVVKWMFGYEDEMYRALFHSESKFLHVDENGQFGESPCPADGVKFRVLLTVCDLTLASKRRYLEAVKKKWEEVGSASEGGQMMMIYVDMGVSWEESKRRVREILPYLPRGSTAWIAPDDRARLQFIYSLFKKADKHRITEYEPTVIASISTGVDEEGLGNIWLHDFIIPDYTPDFEYAHIFGQLLSPILEARAFLRKYL
ncbi:hypothetical protein SUGI_1016220 [Cryptomeria japonica]|uniref:disease resistance protein TAO1 n=1 Tax=Cryptomeria japonica TaxID=3369 RepID=UPI0024148CE0|nr:disease resistance protein TAO1 [Cryptomeria japonica]GLJ48130.1 hypothetical protein SUGI_1016220 [Cryptomeria japonica]